MSANPTATSADATANTIIANTWPVISPVPYLQRATRLILTAFNINSMPRRMATSFFRARTPKSPMQKRAADKIRYQERGMLMVPPILYLKLRDILRQPELLAVKLTPLRMARQKHLARPKLFPTLSRYHQRQEQN